jgi:hypothetical protein
VGTLRARGKRGGGAEKERDGNPDGKTSPRAYMRLNTEGWQVAIDAKLFYQSVGGYFSLFC